MWAKQVNDLFLHIGILPRTSALNDSLHHIGRITFHKKWIYVLDKLLSIPTQLIKSPLGKQFKLYLSGMGNLNGATISQYICHSAFIWSFPHHSPLKMLFHIKIWQKYHQKKKKTQAWGWTKIPVLWKSENKIPIKCLKRKFPKGRRWRLVGPTPPLQIQHDPPRYVYSFLPLTKHITSTEIFHNGLQHQASNLPSSHKILNPW